MKAGDTALRHGYRVEVFDHLGSTNDEALARARAGDPGRVWIVAREQGQGRGRSGRAWSSPPGNLYATLLLVAPCAMAIGPQLGFVAGVALHRAVAARSGLSVPRLGLKWPNDLLLDRAKLAGILVEGASLPGGAFAAAVGIGVNVAHHPADTPYPATDLAAKGVPASTDAVFEALSDAMAETLATWSGGQRFGEIRADWLARAGGLGERITVRRPDGERRGIFVDLDADGRLLLDEAGRRLRIEAGDVFLAPPANGDETIAPERMD